ncbi:hypothetical protein OSTOST_13820, partial [Ostertagia ostertagi]
METRQHSYHVKVLEKDQWAIGNVRSALVQWSSTLSINNAEKESIVSSRYLILQSLIIAAPMVRPASEVPYAIRNAFDASAPMGPSHSWRPYHVQNHSPPTTKGHPFHTKCLYAKPITIEFDAELFRIKLVQFRSTLRKRESRR